MNTLICVAELPGDERVLRFGTLMARTLGSNKTTVLHVRPQEASQADGEALLAAASRELDDLSHDTRLASGVPAKGILSIAGEGDYDLLILGARHTADMEERPIGRVARQVAANTSASTLIVKGESTALQRILVCSGARPIANPVIQMGARLAELANSKATLLHVTSSVPSMYTGLGAMEESIEDMLSRDTPEAQHLREGMQAFFENHVDTVLELRHGVAADEIIRATQLRDYDLIVVGASDAAPRLNRLLFGEVTETILNSASASVLVARASSTA